MYEGKICYSIIFSCSFVEVNKYIFLDLTKNQVSLIYIFDLVLWNSSWCVLNFKGAGTWQPKLVPIGYSLAAASTSQHVAMNSSLYTMHGPKCLDHAILRIEVVVAVMHSSKWLDLNVWFLVCMRIYIEICSLGSTNLLTWITDLPTLNFLIWKKLLFYFLTACFLAKLSQFLV